jgi:hypothetical protein
MQECRRVIKDTGIYIFSVISIPEGLSASDYALALEYGPPMAEVNGGYPATIEKAGWTLTERNDQTEAYTLTINKMLVEEQAHAAELTSLLGEEAYQTRIDRRAKRVEALQMGIVTREQFVARPG